MWASFVFAVCGLHVAFEVADAMAMGGLFVDVNSGGCVGARLCCPGKDHTCSVYERLTEEANATRCFCDSDCLVTGDCCHDYQHYCQPVDCLLEETWMTWGKCSVRCGMGVRKRTRRIIRYPRNGGKECASTIQHGVCEGVSCKVPRALSTKAQKMSEIAYILPISVARWRNDSTYSTSSGIRRNLQVKGRFRFRSLNGASKNIDNYCAIYRMTKVGRMCNSLSTIDKSPAAASPAQLTNWTTDLVSGMVVCVECQRTAAHPSFGDRCQGDGVYGKQTHWAAMTVPGCNGKWTMIVKPNACKCLSQSHDDEQEIPTQNGFIFV